MPGIGPAATERALAKRLSGLDAKGERLLDLAADGILGKADLTARLSAVEDERRRVEGERSRAEARVDEAAIRFSREVERYARAIQEADRRLRERAQEDPLPTPGRTRSAPNASSPGSGGSFRITLRTR